MSRGIIRHKILPLTQQEETFALEYMKHGSAQEAARVAYPQRKPTAISALAHRLINSKHIKTRLSQLAEAATVNTELSAETLVAEIKKNIEGARELGDYGASNKAIELAMRYRGMIGEKVAVEKDTGVNVNLNLFSSGDKDKDLTRLANIAGFVPAKKVP